LVEEFSATDVVVFVSSGAPSPPSWQKSRKGSSALSTCQIAEPHSAAPPSSERTCL